MKGQKYQLLVFLIFYWICGSQQGFITQNNWYRVIQFTPCKESDSYTFKINKFKMVEVKDDVIMIGEIEISEDVEGEITLEILPSKCDFAKKRCDERQSLRFDEICKSMNSFNMFGDSFKQHIQPPLTCPFKKGIYKFNNVTANIGIISKFPIGGHLWAAEIKFIDSSQKTIFCGNSGILIKDPRKRGNSGK